jgi:hypothetical protein
MITCQAEEISGDPTRPAKVADFPPVAGLILLDVPFWFDRTKPVRQRTIRSYYGSDDESVWGVGSPECTLQWMTSADLFPAQVSIGFVPSPSRRLTSAVRRPHTYSNLPLLNIAISMQRFTKDSHISRFSRVGSVRARSLCRLFIS